MPTEGGFSFATFLTDSSQYSCSSYGSGCSSSFLVTYSGVRTFPDGARPYG
jgi:hypothetical protein